MYLHKHKFWRTQTLIFLRRPPYKNECLARFVCFNMSSPHRSTHIYEYQVNIRWFVVCHRRFLHMNDGGRPATAALPRAMPPPRCRRRQRRALTKLPPPPPSWPPPLTPRSHQAAATAAKLAAALPPPPPLPLFPSSSSLLSSSPFLPAGAGEAG